MSSRFCEPWLKICRRLSERTDDIVPSSFEHTDFCLCELMPRILMCPPDYYGIEYEINPWMSRQRQSDRQAAAAQWTALKQLLEQAGANIELLPPQLGLPDLVFTANAALIYRKMAVMARFR